MRAFPTILAILALLTGPMAGCLQSAETVPDGPLDPASTQPPTANETAAASQATEGQQQLDAANATSGPGPDERQPAPPPARTIPRVPMTFPVNATAVHKVSWTNGTLSPQAVATGLTPDSEANRVRIDLAGLLPAGVPAWLTAELTYKRPSTEPGQLAPYGRYINPVFLEIEEEIAQDTVTRWSLSRPVATAPADPPEAETVTQRLDAVVTRPTGDSPALIVEADSVHPVDGTDFTLELTVHADAASLPERAPIALDIDPGLGTLEATVVRGSSAHVWIWGPDDALITRQRITDHPTRLDIPTTGPSGEHVLLVTGSQAGLRLTAPQGATGTPRLLELTTTRLEAHALEPQGPTRFSFEVTERPLAVGLAPQADQDAGPEGEAAPAQLTAGLNGTLAGPSGPLMSFQAVPLMDCQACSSVAWRTPLGQAGLGAGTYTVEATADASLAGELVPFTVRYVRSPG